MLIAVFFGLACLVAALGYLMLPAIGYWQNALRFRAARQDARNRLSRDLPNLEGEARRKALEEYGQIDRYLRDEWLGNLCEAVLRNVAGVALFVIGLTIMAAVLTTGAILALIFGPAFLYAAFWALRHYRRNWRRFAQGRHRAQVLLHLVAIPTLAVIGVLILIAGL